MGGNKIPVIHIVRYCTGNFLASFSKSTCSCEELNLFSKKVGFFSHAAITSCYVRLLYKLRSKLTNIIFH